MKKIIFPVLIVLYLVSLLLPYSKTMKVSLYQLVERNGYSFVVGHLGNFILLVILLVLLLVIKNAKARLVLKVLVALSLTYTWFRWFIPTSNLSMGQFFQRIGVIFNDYLLVGWYVTTFISIVFCILLFMVKDEKTWW